MIFYNVYECCPAEEGSKDVDTSSAGANVIIADGTQNDGHQIRQIATEHNVTIFTSLDTVSVLLDVLEETTLTVSTIDA